MKELLIKSTTASALALLTAFSLATHASAQGIVLDNSGNLSDGSHGVSAPLVLAQSFTTGSDATSLNAITTFFSNDSGNGFQLALYSDNSGTVGSPIATLSGTDSPDGAETYTAASTIALSPETAYWWVASSSSGSFNINSTADNSYLSTDGWTISQGLAINLFNGGWEYSGSGGDNLQFMVNATITPTPEPSASALMLFGVGTGAVFCHRRRALR